MLPAMRSAGYDDDVSAALTATASCMGPIIPPSIPFIIYGVIANVSIASLFLALAWWLCRFPMDTLTLYPSSTLILDRNGQRLRVTLGENDVSCQPISLERMGQWIIPAIIAVEDKRFFHHRGVDLLAIARAIGQDLAARKIVSGASTISTQLIRLVEPRRRCLPVKLIEAVRAVQMEERFSKQQILEQYLNRVPLGANLVGIEAASRCYFGKSAADLSLAEAALLAGLPQSPTRLRPDRHPDRAQARRNHVLECMVRCGFITNDQKLRAQEVFVPHPSRPLSCRASHFCDLVLARNPHRSELLTTLDANLQLIAETALRRCCQEWGAPEVNGAVVILEVRTGAVRALVSAPDFSDSQVNGATARRSPGSTLKPFLFALAMDQGLCTPATVLQDEPVRYAGYRPQNFGRDFSGPVTVREVLVRSLNIPSMKMTGDVGQENFVRHLRRLGLATLERPASHYGLGITLGDGEVTLLDLSNAYACLARLGLYQPARLLETDPLAPPQTLFSPEAAYLITDILGGDERAIDLSGHVADVERPRLAWKTGTSTGLRDAWTIAYNPEYVVGVWVGRPPQSHSAGLIGRKVAAPVTEEIFRGLYPRGTAPWFRQPAGLRLCAVCPVSGCQPTEYCPSASCTLQIVGVTAQRPCPTHTRYNNSASLL